MSAGHAIARGEHRRAPRERSNVRVKVKYQGRELRGRLFDISTTGLGVEMTEAFFAPPGGQIVIESDEIGALQGTIRWRTNSRIGVSFGASSNAAAKVDAYFKNFHKGVTRPTLVKR